MKSNADKIVPECNCVGNDKSPRDHISDRKTGRVESLACGMICPECGSVVFFQSGCPLCPACGFSRCG